MNLRTTTRVSAALGLLLALIGAVSFVLTPTAEALSQDRITIGEDETFSATYGPLAAPDTVANLSQPTSINTTTCEVAPYCDVIPLTVEEPRTFDPEDTEYFVKITLDWTTVTVESLDQSATDLDLYIVNDPFVEDAGPDENGFAYKSTSPSNPEYTTMYMPAGDWNILVDNYASVPTFYTITVEWLTRELPGTPFESLPPSFSETGVITPSPAAKPSLATPPAPRPTPSPVFDVPEPATPNLAPSAPPVADASFSEGFDDDGGLADAIAAPPTTVLDFTPSAKESLPSPSALSLLLWLLALPLLLVAVAGWVLQRRHATDITF